MQPSQNHCAGTSLFMYSSVSRMSHSSLSQRKAQRTFGRILSLFTASDVEEGGWLMWKTFCDHVELRSS